MADLSFIEKIALFDAEARPLFHTATPYGTALPPAVNLAQLERILKTGKPETSNLFIGYRLTGLIDMRNTMPTGASVTITRLCGHDARICDLTPSHDHQNRLSRCQNVWSR